MIRQIRKWLRVVVPLEEAGGVFFVFWAISYVIFGLAAFLGAIDPWTAHASILTFFLYLVAFVYAAYRAIYFNPVENLAYGKWLMDSPWESSRPLPLGPLHFVWQDAVIIGVLILLLPHKNALVFGLVTSFLGLYALCIAYSVAKVGIYRPAYLVAALLGGLILVAPNSLGTFLIAIAMSVLANLASHEFLQAFPFSPDQRDRLRLTTRRLEAESPSGWPVPPTSRERYRWRISHGHALGVSILFIWLAFCSLCHAPQSDVLQRMGKATCFQAMLVCVGFRCWLYLWGYAPPISLFGRIFKLRPIIPRYDVVLVAPLCAFGAACMLPAILLNAGCPALVAYPLVGGLCIWLTLALPPSREDWIYTGAHRVCFRILASKEESNATRRRRQSFRLSR